MKRTVLLELYEEHDAVNFYTVRFSDETISEVDKFLDDFSSDEFLRGTREISRDLENIMKDGALERYFRPEGSYYSSLSALPLIVEEGSVRVFCLRMHDGILILGNGYQKTDRPYNEDPVAKSHANLLEILEKMLRARLNDGRVTEYQNQYFGNKHLKFVIDL